MTSSSCYTTHYTTSRTTEIHNTLLFSTPFARNSAEESHQNEFKAMLVHEKLDLIFQVRIFR